MKRNKKLSKRKKEDWEKIILFEKCGIERSLE